MKFWYAVSCFFFLIACSKNDTPSASNSSATVPEKQIQFTVSPDITLGTINLSVDTFNLTVSVNSTIPTAGLIYTIDVKRSDTALTVFRIDSLSALSTMSIKLTGFTIKANYVVKISVTSQSSALNSASQSVQINRGRVYKNYLKTSYFLSNPDSWVTSDNLYKTDATRYTYNPLIDQQTAQVDINGDGLEDLFYYQGYDLNINPTPNPPPVVLMNNGSIFKIESWKGPSIKDPHGTKILIGDYNNDSLPDLFAAVATDPPINIPYTVLNNCHLIFNSNNGFDKVLEFPDLGFWYSACSGDIDNDGDLDIFVSNFHLLDNGVKNRILWNDGKGNFTKDESGISDINVIDQSELVDINNDGFLDLILVFIPSTNPSRINDFRILWGNGKGFSLNNSVSISISGEYFLQGLDFVDIDKDGIMEIIPSGNYTLPNSPMTYFISLYKSDDKGKTFIDQTNKYIDKNTSSRFGNIIIKDIDKNGLVDIFSADKKDNIRWEWNGSKFIRQ